MRALRVPFQFLIYLAFRALEAGVTLFPLKTCGAIGSALGGLTAWFAAPYVRLTRRNLRIAFGEEKSESEIDDLTKRHFRALGRNFFFSLKIGRMTTAEIEGLVTWEGLEHIEAAAAQGRGVIAAIAHLGPWELLARLPSLGSGVATGTLYQRLGNPFMNDFIVKRRGKSGTILFDRSTGIYGPLKHVREGGGVGVLIDQHSGDHGIWCPFFGRLASTTNLPALLSLRSDAPIVSILLLPDGPDRWRVVYRPAHDPREFAGDNQSVAAEITSKLNLELETVVRESPEDWFWVHDRWKTPNPRLMLSGYRRGLHLTGEQAKNLKPFRLLVRSPNPLGDACMAIPATRLLRRGRPDLHLTILCRENVAPVWRRQPEVDEVLAIPPGASLWATGKLLRARAGYDAAVLFPNSLRAGLEAWLGGVPRRIGYRGHTRGRLLDQIVPEWEIGPPRHHAHHYLRIAENTGAVVEDATELFRMPRPPEGPPRLGVCPGAVYGPAKRWPVERFAEVISGVHEQSPCPVSIFGSPEEREIGDRLTAALGFPCENRVGKTSIDGLMDELRACRLLLTNDTGTMHLAAMLGVPTVSIFGSTEPELTRPIGPRHRVIRRRAACSPCFLRECPLDFRCMDEIETDSVTKAVLAMLRG